METMRTENGDLSKLKQLQFKYNKNTIVTAGNKCPICRKKYTFRQNLLLHIQRYHRHVKSFKCPHCPLLFSNSQLLQRHIKCHEKPFNVKHICEYCLKSFKNICKLYQHLMHHIVGRELLQNAMDNNSDKTHDLKNDKELDEELDDECDQKLEQKSDQKGDKKLDEKLDQKTDRNLDKKLSKKSQKFGEKVDKKLNKSHDQELDQKPEQNLVNELAKNSDQKLDKELNKEHICKVCSSSFATFANLSRHLKFYAKTPPYTCANVLCKKTNHICSICSKCFKNEHGLSTHFSVHSKTETYPCKLCNLTFKREYNLTMHNLKSHLINKGDQIICKFCSKFFLLRHHLKYHMLKKHANEQSILEGDIKNQDLEDFSDSNVTSNSILIKLLQGNENGLLTNDIESSNDTEHLKKISKEESFKILQDKEESIINMQHNDQKALITKSQEKGNTKNMHHENVSNNKNPPVSKQFENLKKILSGDKNEALTNKVESSKSTEDLNKMSEQESFKVLKNKEKSITNMYKNYQISLITKGQEKNSKKHQNTHFNQDAKNYECKICNRTYRHEGSLFNHLRKAHGKERDYACSVYNMPFKLLDELRIHRKIHSNKDTKHSEQAEDFNKIKITDTSLNKDKDLKVQLKMNSKTSDQDKEDLNIKIEGKNKTSSFIDRNDDTFKELKIKISVNIDSKTSDHEEDLNITKVTEKDLYITKVMDKTHTSPIGDNKNLFMDSEIQKKTTLSQDFKTYNQKEDLKVLKVTAKNKTNDLFKNLAKQKNTHLKKQTKTSNQEKNIKVTGKIKDKKNIEKVIVSDIQIEQYCSEEYNSLSSDSSEYPAHIHRDWKHIKTYNHPKDRRYTNKNSPAKVNLENVVLEDSDANTESLLIKVNEEAEKNNLVKTKTQESYSISTLINENRVEKNFKLKSVNNNVHTKPVVIENEKFSTEFLKDLEIQPDSFGNHLNKVTKIKEERCNDGDFDFNSILEISNTEFTYDKALVNSAKRKRHNRLSIDSIENNESLNTLDTQAELQVFNTNNHITKLKLRYKLLKGKCTSCNKTFDCPQDYVKHGLDFHPSKETHITKQPVCTAQDSTTPQPTKAKSTQFLIPTIKVNGMETYGSPSIEKKNKKTNEMLFEPNEIFIKEEKTEEFISFTNIDIKKDEFIVGD